MAKTRQPFVPYLLLDSDVSVVFDFVYTKIHLGEKHIYMMEARHAKEQHKA